jgi:uncharacterized protein YdeI (BOF family)
MKKLLILAVAFTISAAAFAQHIKMDSTMPATRDYVMMKGGKMMVMHDGKTMVMDKDMPMGNGMIVMKDGTVKTKDGNTIKMKEGDSMLMNGKMIKGRTKMDKPLP